MLSLLYKTLTINEKYFELAKKTECEIKLPIVDDVVIYFSSILSNDYKWRFWMDYCGLITSIGTMEQIKAEESIYDYCNIPERCLILIANNLELISKQMAMLLPELLYNHVLKWEEKITYDNDDSRVDFGPNSWISLREAKLKLLSHYQFVASKNCLDTSNLTATLMHYELPSGDNGSVSFNRERNSFTTTINDNCVEEIEAAILHIIAQKIETQDFLTVGQLGLLQFLKNQASV